MAKCKTQENPCHKKDMPRLNRAIGQLDGVKDMIEDGRYCVDILMQLKAVRSAIKSLEAEIFKTHIKSCVNNAKSDKDLDKKLKELGDLYKKHDV